MNKITPDPPVSSDSSPNIPLNTAAQRAMRYYHLREANGLPDRLFTVPASIGAEDALNHACEILECASVTAYEAADGLLGQQRKLALAVVHLLEMAHTLVDAALSRQSAQS